MVGVPYWRLSSLYFFYFAVVGVISPYWGLYLDDLGFNGSEIGVLVAIPMLTRVVAPNIWGWLSDTTGQYLRVIQFGSIAAVIAFVGVLLWRDYWGLVLATTLFTFFWNAVLPQFEVITLDFLGEDTHLYSHIRLWGSIGFICAVVVLGFLFDLWSVATLPWIVFFLLMCIAFSSFTLFSNPAKKHSKVTAPFRETLKSKFVISFLLASFLLHASHGVYYGFFSLYLIDHGYSSVAVGMLWALGVVAEIVLFLKMPVIFRRFSILHCYLFCLVASAVRWLIVGWFVDSVVILTLSQVLHAFTFGLAHAVAMVVVRDSFGVKNRGQGQALYSAICFGAGGAIGAYVSGQLWMINPSACFVFSAGLSVLGCFVVFGGMKTPCKA